MPPEDFVVLEQMNEHPLVEADLHELGRTVDAAMEALAGNVALGPNTTVLAALIWVENLFHARGGPLDYSALVSPILDRVAPRVAAPAAPVPLDGAAVLAVEPLIAAGRTYGEITGAIMNTLKNRAEARREANGRVVVYPRGDVGAERRSRWFERRWRAERHGAGRAAVPPNAAASVAQIDVHIQLRAQEVEEGRCDVPIARWYDEHCGAIVDAVLDGQFAHVHDAEVWAGLAVADLKRALRSLWMRAARRLFVHQRAAKWLRECAERRPTALLSAIECVTPAELQADFEAAGLTGAQGTALLRSMTRNNAGERYPLETYPLVPLQDGRLAFIPSCILYGNWPMARERAAARNDGGRIGNVRDFRNLARVVNQLQPFFPQDSVQTEVLLRQDEGQDITDLDVVCVSEDRREVLVLQLKSFVTPLNLMELDRADEDVEHGLEQCERAAAHLDKIEEAVEGRTRAPLAPGWSLRQCVVTEAYTGTTAPRAAFPVVSIEWLENEGLAALAAGGIAEFHRRAQTLPDGQAFFDSCEPLYVLVEDGESGLEMGTSWAIWSYTSE